MVSKTEAIVALNIVPPLFRDACERLGIDPDSDYYSDHDIMLIRHKTGAGKIDTLQPGVGIAEAAEILGVTSGTFRTYHSKFVKRLRRGVYCRESLERYKVERDRNKQDRTPPREAPRLHRIQVDEYEGGASITFHVEGDLKEIIGRIADVLTK